ncbi:hypothetical protein BDB00DRAFT_152730 [Zychaea mexicana]|uniref:uncharacterized protein n=1 Tax=Zychaea mexicana TaxID=64656 RepID=UPI0022FDEF26|nr:uncharacterized protein BDB00DRAFT_152730 [Zychaea mexicana]KAI9484370.1 hypothetical protein BDB00DRAFT_152730 [Zychaea mexicana]
METNAPSRFTLCNNDQCCNKFNFIDVATVHSVVDGPDPRDHCANERNLLTWLLTGMVLVLIGKVNSIYFSTQQPPHDYTLVVEKQHSS